MTIRRFLFIILSLDAALLAAGAVFCGTRVGQPSSADPGQVAVADVSYAPSVRTDTELPDSGRSVTPGYVEATGETPARASGGDSFQPASNSVASGQAPSQLYASYREPYIPHREEAVPAAHSSTGQTNTYPLAASRVAGAGVAAPHSSPAAAAQTQTARVPLVFSDTSDLNLNAAQQQQIADMQQDFVDAVGDSGSPDYTTRWQNAQGQIDQEFRQKFGWQAFVQQQLTAARQGTTLSAQ